MIDTFLLLLAFLIPTVILMIIVGLFCMYLLITGGVIGGEYNTLEDVRKDLNPINYLKNNL